MKGGSLTCCLSSRGVISAWLFSLCYLLSPLILWPLGALPSLGLLLQQWNVKSRHVGIAKWGVLPTFCPFWESKINKELLQWTEFNCCSQHCLCCDFSLQIPSGWCCTSGKCPCFETPNAKKMLGKGTFCGITNTHTHSLGKCGCSRITLDELGESEVTPNSMISSQFPLFSFLFLQSGNWADFYQVQDDLEIIWCLSVTGQEDKNPLFPPFKHPELQKRHNLAANREFKWERKDWLLLGSFLQVNTSSGWSHP